METPEPQPDSSEDFGQRVGAWARAQSPMGLVSAMTGMMAVVDFFTVVLGITLGTVALTTGWRGLDQSRKLSEKRGRRLCQAGMVMGGLGILLSVLMWVFVYGREA